MARTLFLGLGGTGSRVIAKVAKELENNHVAINEGAVYCAALDTHGKDFEYMLKTIGVETPVPAVSADSPQTVGDLLRKYPEASEWFVDDVPILDSEVIYSASAVRMKSRLAFLDTYRSGRIKPLEDLIEKMQNGMDRDIRAVLISSVENGMLLQTALWLRDQFKKNGKEIALCGILLLPDVFAKTVAGVSGDDSFGECLYANAYAAIRELNAVSKIKKNPDGVSPQIRIENLFASDDLKNPLHSEKDVFDTAFFVDYTNRDGAHLNTIRAYEEQAARFAYMRFCFPIQNIEDRQALSFLRQKGFSFGAFGVAKAVYPKENVKEYCVLRAVSDVIGGWLTPDREIKAIRKREEEMEKAGECFTRVDPVEKYTELFEEHMRAKGFSAEKTPFFASLKEDTLKNKAKNFLQTLEKRIALAIEENNGGGKGFSRLNALGIDLENTVMQTYHFVEFSKELLDRYSVDILKAIVTENTAVFAEEKAVFEEETVKKLSERTLREVFPQNESALDEKSLYGMLTIPNGEAETRSFVHPVTARYLLYKLRAEIAEAIRETQAEKENVRNRLDSLEDEVYFDYGRTKHNVETMYNYFEKPPRFWEGSADTYKQHFIRKYREYVQKQYAYGKEYEIRTVCEKTLCALGLQVEKLIEKMEAFFAKLPALIEICEKRIAENTEATKRFDVDITVCAGKKAKEMIYRSLGVKFDGSDKRISRLVIDGVFEAYRTDADHAKSEIMNAFFRDIFDFYMNKMEQTYAENIELDMETALKTEAQSEGEEDYEERMQRLTEALKSRAVPYLQYTESENCLEVSVWGCHSGIGKACVGMHAEGSEAYPKNELSCCTVVYQLSAEDFPKLKENASGEYYGAYRNITSRLDASKPYTLMQTPYLDKTWHEILPPLSEKKD